MTRTSRSAPAGLSDQIQQGGELAYADLNATALAGAAEALGVVVHIADCDRARSRSAVLRAISKAVDFPEFFGSSLEDLYDCLCDVVLDQKAGVVLVLRRLHSEDPSLEKEVPAIVGVFQDAVAFAHENGRIFAYGIEHSGRHVDPPEAQYAATA